MGMHVETPIRRKVDIDSARLACLVAAVSPLWAVFHAVKNMEDARRRAFLIFIITLFGSTIVLKNADGSRLQQMIYDHYVALPFAQWLFELKEILIFSPEPGTKGDVFSHFFSYLFGRVFGAPDLYFIFVSFVYGYFFVHGISKVLRSFSWNAPLLCWLLVIIFVSYRFVDNVQTVRTWTGLWVLFNGVYGYHETKRVRYVFLMLMAPMLHVAYFLMALPAFVMVVLPRLSPAFISLLYICSFFVSVPHGAILDQFKSTELGQEKVGDYYRENPEDYAKVDLLKHEEANWYNRYGKGMSVKNAPHVLALSVILMGLFSSRRMSYPERALFATGVLTATMANMLDFIFAVYSRTMINAGIYILAASTLLAIRGGFFSCYGWVLTFRRGLLWCSVLAFFPYLVYVVANMMQFTSVFMIGCPFFGLFDEINISLREFIGYLIGR